MITLRYKNRNSKREYEAWLKTETRYLFSLQVLFLNDIHKKITVIMMKSGFYFYT